MIMSKVGRGKYERKFKSEEEECQERGIGRDELLKKDKEEWNRDYKVTATDTRSVDDKDDTGRYTLEGEVTFTS